MEIPADVDDETRRRIEDEQHELRMSVPTWVRNQWIDEDGPDIPLQRTADGKWEIDLSYKQGYPGLRERVARRLGRTV